MDAFIFQNAFGQSVVSWDRPVFRTDICMILLYMCRWFEYDIWMFGDW